MKKILKFLLKWNELLTIPIALLLWHLSPMALHWIDGTSSTYDYGVFQIILFSIIQLLIYNGVVFLTIKLSWPGIYKYLDDTLEHKILFNGSITPWEKVKLVLWVFSLYMIVIAILSRVI